MSSGRSRADFLKFLDYLGEKGLLPAATASSRKATANRVLSILSPEEASDITSIDLDDLMKRFHNINGQQYTQESLLTYKSRMRTALEDFRAYCTNPLGFKPSGQSRSKAKSNAEKARPQVGPKQPNSVATTPTAPVMSVSILPIPLRSNLTVQIAGLPFDLSRSEAQKIANIILAHAQE